ncbi:flavin-containing monooxygenase [Alcanivorax hongdengensis A-11-3]|uniref:Flavin-containing monooxygenase n=1 Tax=Alcanivorax hongdengensis A-11-3 TaxID=1177179 RepID=L0WD80_9GAMM|nr:NAD(P)-binding domain-containing protein [Alcanivorax hongdengensis]EKF73725.1 flavin-containing monooxygenase [Alcanivorax hongdengensis A-11-3]
MYAVIGAGPMGLATARNLKKYDIPFVGFELHSDVGGLWDIDNPHSTMYQSAHLISSKTMTEFREFPMADSVATYPHHSELKNYFQDYARQFGLYEHYEFATRVLEVEPDGDGWQVTTECEGVSQKRYFDGVLIANGTLHTPNDVPLPGAFDGELMHANTYCSPDIFRDKRVLIVGCGNSACDIAVDAVHHAASVDLSVRRGYYFLPKFIAGKPTDTIGGKFKLPRGLKQRLDARLIKLIIGSPSDYGLPDPDYRLYESHPVINSLVLHHLGHGDIHARRDIKAVDGKTVTFADGDQQDYDLILMATGYKLDYPFISRAHLNWQDSDAPRLYLNVFHPQYHNLFMMGMVEAAGLGWEGRNEQAEMVALYIRARQQKKACVAGFDQLKKEQASQPVDGGFQYLKLARMAYYVHKDSYRQAVLGHIEQFKK